MDIALNTDFLMSRFSPEKYLRLISEAGFTHLHWCHQWNTDYLYSTYEIAQYKKWLKEYNLKLLDIHGSMGQEKMWFSFDEYRRKSGVLLVLNRIIMLDELEGTGSIMMHIPAYRSSTKDPAERAEIAKMTDTLKRTIDELIPYLEKYHTKIAVENTRNDSFEVIAELMDSYSPEHLGITLDTGHANIDEARGLDCMENHLDRLEALHLNDNDTSGDQHQPPFYGTLDWERIANMLAKSSYPATGRPLSFELAMRCTPFMVSDVDPKDQPDGNIKAFLADTYERCVKVVGLYEKALNQSAR